MNTPLESHPLIGTTQTYMPMTERLSVVPEVAEAGGGTLVVAPGMDVVIVSLFREWNTVAGLDMAYVFVPDTGLHTHVTPASMGLML